MATAGILKNPETGRRLALAGAWMQAAPVLGMLVMIHGMIRAFNSMAGNTHASADQLHQSIGISLVAVAAGTVLAVLGVVLILIALLVSRYRAEWFFWFLVVYGAVCLLAFPVGTIIGVFFLVYGLSNRSEFQGSAAGMAGDDPSGRTGGPPGKGQ